MNFFSRKLDFFSSFPNKPPAFQWLLVQNTNPRKNHNPRASVGRILYEKRAHATHWDAGWVQWVSFRILLHAVDLIHFFLFSAPHRVT